MRRRRSIELGAALALVGFALVGWRFLPPPPPPPPPRSAPSDAAVAVEHPARDRRLDWSAEPRRVDRTLDALPRDVPAPRVANPYPIVLQVPATVTVADNASFSFGDKRYRLVNITPVPANALCLDEKERRWACGARLRAGLRAAIAGRYLRCRSAGAEDALECTRDGRLLTGPSDLRLVETR
jgi:hypothetical protein